jgi:hypothetical protein
MRDGGTTQKTDFACASFCTSDASSTRKWAQYRDCKTFAHAVSPLSPSERCSKASEADEKKLRTVRELTRRYLQDDPSVKFMLQKLEEVPLP